MKKSVTFTIKVISVVLILSSIFLVPGCSSFEKRGETIKYVVNRKSDEVSVDDLGDIRADGDFNECNPENMLKYVGYYKGPDYVTLVFDDSSPISIHNVELFISEEVWVSSFLDGILYRNESGKKYVEFKFETVFHGSSQMDTAKGAREFKLPTKESEYMSYYEICILPFVGFSSIDYDACVAEYKQNEVVEQSGYGFVWKDYKYDVVCQYYFADSDNWETEKYEDRMTDLAPVI